MSSVSDIKLIRTDTTLDLSQKAEKRLYYDYAIILWLWLCDNIMIMIMIMIIIIIIVIIISWLFAKCGRVEFLQIVWVVILPVFRRCWPNSSETNCSSKHWKMKMCFPSSKSPFYCKTSWSHTRLTYWYQINQVGLEFNSSFHLDNRYIVSDTDNTRQGQELLCTLCGPICGSEKFLSVKNNNLARGKYTKILSQWKFMIICENVHTLGYPSRVLPIQPKTFSMGFRGNQIHSPIVCSVPSACILNQEEGRCLKYKVFQFLLFGILMELVFIWIPFSLLFFL